MKEICAIIRIDKINETKRALADAGFPSVTAKKCVGRGKGNVEYLIRSNIDTDELEESSNPSEKGPKLMPKRMLVIVVPDSRKDKAVEALIKSNQTGKQGDGKIFVMPVLDAIRVRTGEDGDAAIDEQV
ncbi:MAG TPA: P-II family nitrogen regulator [Lentisphaeria bacterium]|nr:MAG: nitrogen fixation protein [Lentisphaerae bacterium GWF2_50_93]HCE43491.1 P-II family nitrogen regulator [Lentisphaeria bacterium]